MRKDSWFLAFLLVFGTVFIILYFIDPSLITVLKNRIIDIVGDLWILLQNKIMSFGI